MLSLWRKQIAVSRSNPDVIYTTNEVIWSPFPNNPILKSTNRGASWFGVTPPTGPSDDVGMVAVDPANENVVYATAWTGDYKSTNGGASWTRVFQLSGDWSSITVDPANSSMVYATTGQGVYKSTDAGASWAQANTGIANV